METLNAHVSSTRYLRAQTFCSYLWQSESSVCLANWDICLCVVAGLEGMLRAPPRGLAHSPQQLVACIPTLLPLLSSPP
eukprot:1143247-Pelagomonas_calceolata.AAC.20